MDTRILTAGVMAALLTAGGAASAGDTCQSFVAAGETYFDGAGFEGSALTNLGDLAIGDFGDRTVAVALLDQRETGTGLLATTAHTFTGPDGAFSTYDNAQLVELSPGLYRLDTQGSIVDGAWGHITVDGIVDLRRGWARWYARGQVCGL